MAEIAEQLYKEERLANPLPPFGVESGAGMDDRRTARELASVARKIGALDHERRELNQGTLRTR
jgi:hypothetical protein